MVDWRKWLGGGDGDPQPPNLDAPDVMAARVEAKRKTDLVEWSARLARAPHLLDQKTSRPKIEAVLKSAGYRRFMSHGEALWRRDSQNIVLVIHVTLKTSGGDGSLYAPSQRLAMGGSIVLPIAAKVSYRLLPVGGKMQASGHAPELVRTDFILERTDIEQMISEMETALKAIDLDALLAVQRRKGGSLDKDRRGVSHLVALVLGGQTDILSDYDHLLRSGADAGLLPYVTDAMVAEALSLAYLVEIEGLDGLDKHLG